MKLHSSKEEEVKRSLFTVEESRGEFQGRVTIVTSVSIKKLPCLDGCVSSKLGVERDPLKSFS